MLAPVVSAFLPFDTSGPFINVDLMPQVNFGLRCVSDPLGPRLTEYVTLPLVTSLWVQVAALLLPKPHCGSFRPFMPVCPDLYLHTYQNPYSSTTIYL